MVAAGLETAFRYRCSLFWLPELPVNHFQGTESRNGQEYGCANRNKLQHEPFFSRLFVGPLSVFRSIVIGDVDWQADYSLEFSWEFFLSLTALGLLIFTYGVFKFIQSILEFEEESSESCQYSHVRKNCGDPGRA